MAEVIHVTINSCERDLLLRMLQEASRDKRVEIHRTEFSHEFRRHLEGEESLISDLITKISGAVEVA